MVRTSLEIDLFFSSHDLLFGSMLIAELFRQILDGLAESVGDP